MLVVHPGHRFADERSIDVNELGTERPILFDRTSSYFVLTSSFFREAGITPRGVMELDNVDATKKMVEHGLGIAFLPYTAVRGELAAETLREVSIEGFDPSAGRSWPSAVATRSSRSTWSRGFSQRSGGTSSSASSGVAGNVSRQCHRPYHCYGPAMTTATMHTSEGPIQLELFSETPRRPSTTSSSSPARVFTTAPFPPRDPRLHGPGRLPEGTGRGGPGYKFDDEMQRAQARARLALDGQRRPQHQRQPVLHHPRRDRLARRQAHGLRPCRRADRRSSTRFPRRTATRAIGRRARSRSTASNWASLERFSFGADAAFAPREEALVYVTVAPLTGSIFRGAPFQAAIFRIAPGGRIARHPAMVPQILAVLEGSGHVSGAADVKSRSPQARPSSGSRARSTRRRAPLA